MGFADCESFARPICTNPGSMEAGECRLTRGTFFVARRLEAVAVAGLLRISLCVFGAAGCRVFVGGGGSGAHGLLQVRGCVASCISLLVPGCVQGAIIQLVCLSACVYVTFVVFTDCESCTRQISTNSGSMEAREYGLTRRTCFVARRLEVVAVAGLLWFSWCVFGRADFFSFFFLLFFSSNAHGLLQV